VNVARHFVQTFFVALGLAIGGSFLMISGYEVSPAGGLFLLGLAGAALRRIDWWCTISLAGSGATFVLIVALLGEKFEVAPIWIMLALGTSPLLGGLIEERLTRYLRWRAAGRERKARVPGMARPRLYCLHCFATLERDTTRCAACGNHSRPSERRIYWNRHPVLRRNERLAKALVVVATVAGCFAILPLGVGTAQGWFILLPTFAGVGLWMTASKITRHELYFRPRLVWALTFAIVGVLLAAKLSPWALLAFAGVGMSHVVANVADRWKQHLQEGRRVPLFSSARHSVARSRKQHR